MAKRRNKNRARRNFASLDRKVRINGEIVEKMLKMEAKTKLDSDMNIESTDDLCAEVQVTGKCALTDGDTENEIDCKENAENILTSVNSKPRGRKPKNKQKTSPPPARPVTDGTLTDEVIIYPTEVDGETCIDIKCGNNEAMLYLSKLCLGSKGACINFSDSWLTPNEFQSVSGRETAKDWKRSIRHKGRSLKLLISKGLITVQSVSPKKSQEKPVSYKVENKDVKTPPISPMIAEPLKDESDNQLRDDTTIEQKADPDIATPIIPRKRGRKPKKSKHWKKGMKFKPSTIDRRFIKPIAITNAMDSKLPLTDDAKLTSLSCANNGNGSEKDAECPDVDIRTDEERRFDEFVKTLRLTKACVPKSAPQLSTIEKVKEELVTPDEEDPEMPVLQKEADIPPTYTTSQVVQEDVQQADITVNVDHLHATVTPPPTPPSERTPTVIDRKTDDEKLIETFKSRLASPSNGLKLTINREKIKAEIAQNGFCKTEIQDEMPPVEKTAAPKSNIQSMLLQDALQSAKRYKEQLKQNSVTPSTTKPIMHVPEVVPKVVDNKKSTNLAQHMPPSSHAMSKHNVYSYPYTKPSFTSSSSSSSSSSSWNTSPSLSLSSPSSSSSIASSMTSSTNIPSTNFSRRPEKERHNPFMPAGLDKNVPSSRHEVFNRRQPTTPLPKLPTTAANGLPSMDIMQNLSGMSFQDFLTVVSSIYGPLPFPVDTKDAAFAALQELHRRHDMSMLNLMTQGQLNGSPSALLYPMMTQQILIAMTQQFYSLYNAPDWSPTTKCAVPKQIPKPEPSESNIRRPTMSSSDSSSKKRKSVDIPDCALDLSVKRPKTENNRNYKTSSPAEVTHFDAPLDFSMKKTQYSHTNSQNNNSNRGRVNERINSMNLSMLDAEHLRRWTSQNDVVTKKSVPVVCTCGNAADDDVTSWSVDQVCYLLQNLDGCAGYAKTFRDQGISGKLLPYLTTQHLTRTLGMKVGPALTLIQAVQDHREKSMVSLSRRQECRVHSHNMAIRTHI